MMIKPTKFLRLLLLNVFFAIKLVENVCLPDCSGFDTPGYKTADPYDCTQYYVCINDNTPSTTPNTCEAGTSFEGGACAGSLPCTPLCGFCHLTCNEGGDIIADPMDCSMYHICLPTGDTVAEQCPPHIPYFNSLLGECTANPDGCCVPSCNPYCEDLDYRLVPDPKDCTKYYACTDPPPFPQFACPAGENFDIVYGVCSPVAACITLCP